jgi:hypothetical protein
VNDPERALDEPQEDERNDLQRMLDDQAVANNTKPNARCEADEGSSA